MHLAEALCGIENGAKVLVIVDGEDDWGPFQHSYPWSFIRNRRLVVWSSGEQPFHGFEINIDQMRFDPVRPNMPRNVISDSYGFGRAARGVRMVTIQLPRDLAPAMHFDLDHASRTLDARPDKGTRQ